MAEAEKKGFFKSRAFILILVWMALGVALSVAIYAARPGMEHACEAWAEELPAEGEHGGGHGGEAEVHDACHLVSLQGHGMHRNLAAAFHAIGGMPLATAWNIPNFLILITIIWYFAKDALNDMFKTKKEDLDKAMAEARRARAEAEEMKAEYERRLGEMGKEMESLVGEMREQGEAEKRRIIDAGEQLAKRIGNDAEFTAKQELLVARYKLREEAARLAVEVAEKVIKQVISEQDRDRLLDEYLEKVMEQKQ